MRRYVRLTSLEEIKLLIPKTDILSSMLVAGAKLVGRLPLLFFENQKKVP